MACFTMLVTMKQEIKTRLGTQHELVHKIVPHCIYKWMKLSHQVYGMYHIVHKCMKVYHIVNLAWKCITLYIMIIIIIIEFKFSGPLSLCELLLFYALWSNRDGSCFHSSSNFVFESVHAMGPCSCCSIIEWIAL